MNDANRLTERIIGMAIDVHRELGPVYEEALCIEFEDGGVPYERQHPFPAIYKGRPIGQYRVDLLVDGRVVLELKSVERYDPVFEAQVLTDLRITGKHLALLINFNRRLLKDGVKRFILESAR